ncbi:MAG: hypothetical protein A2107_12645 [Verrucomicrobia bacterium GWF2_62_7]|nr:MAG: hypothetical protein A2107_12645 [Verrucomicrobia bacterium GWF2_62_7]
MWLGAAAQPQLAAASDNDMEAFFIFCYDYTSGSGPSGAIAAGRAPELGQRDQMVIDAIAKRIQADLESLRNGAAQQSAVAAGRSVPYDQARSQILGDGYARMMAGLSDTARQELARTLSERYKAHLIRWGDSGTVTRMSGPSRSAITGVTFYAWEEIASIGGQIATKSSSWATGPNSMQWAPSVVNAVGYRNDQQICGPWTVSQTPGAVAWAGCLASPSVATYRQVSTHAFENLYTGERVPPYSVAIGAPPNGSCGTNGVCYTTAAVNATVSANGVQEQGKSTHYLYLKQTGQAVITPSMADNRINFDIITWSGGQAGANGTRVVSLASPGTTEVAAYIGSTEVGRVKIHVVDATAPPPAAVDAPKTYSNGGYLAPPAGAFGVVAVMVDLTIGVLPPTYTINAHFDATKWVFRLGGVHHSYKMGINSNGRVHLDLTNVNPLAPHPNLPVPQQYSVARTDFDTAQFVPYGPIIEGPPRSHYWNQSITQAHEDEHVRRFYEEYWKVFMNQFEQYDVEASSVYVTFDCNGEFTTTAAGVVSFLRNNNWNNDISLKYRDAFLYDLETSELMVHTFTNPMYRPIWLAIPVL